MRQLLVCPTMALLLLFPVTLFAKEETATVVRVVDGDTLVVSIDGREEKVRLIGVDTPETVHSNKPVEFFGKEASAFTRKLVDSKRVVLRNEPGREERDGYDRLLRYVFLEDGTHVNAEIIKQGYGHAYTKYPFTRMEEFREYERQAREQGMGLWAALQGIDVKDDESTGMTWYTPHYLPWKAFEYRIFALLGSDDDGRRTMRLNANVQNDKRLGLKTLNIDVDGTIHSFQFKRKEIHRDTSGCRLTESVQIEGDELIRRIAMASHVTVEFVGVRRSRKFDLTTSDLNNFARIVDLQTLQSLPRKPEEEAIAENVNPDDAAIQNPRLITRIKPEFPKFARGQGAKGRVTLHAIILKDGSTDVLEVRTYTTPYCGFEQAAMDAVEQWRYEPGREDGEPVDIYFTVVIDFTYE